MQSSFGGKYSNYLISIGAILVVFLLVPFVVLPQIGKIRDNLEVIKQNKERLAKLEVKAAALEELAQAKDELDRNLAIAEAALPIEKDVAKLVRGVQNLASASGLESTKVEVKPGRTATASASPATPANGETAKTTATSQVTSQNELLFELSLKGNLESYKSFIKSVESSKRLLILSSFKGSSESGSDYTFVVLVSAPFGPLPQISQDQLAEVIADLSANNKKLLEDLESATFNNVTNEPIPTGPTGVNDPFK